MTTVAVVYFSGSDHTHLMAEAVAAGASKVSGTTVELHRITGEQIIKGRWKDDAMMEKINLSDAIIFGSPTYMGGVAAQFKAFIDAASGIWARQGWKNKLAGGFTHSGSPSGDKEGTLLYLVTNAAQHSMIWIGSGEMRQSDGTNRLGSYIGVMGQADPDFTGTKPIEVDPGDLKTSELYGQRIAELTQSFRK
ncbi:flavodoxin family protein [Aphanothece hegewaldii CCALA 016]|uniref:Flavodoxin family protein n=1 Tax=Aphanothece hegewaldii CCALA 016 TaxID=2107694 RepID=A0A2T1LZN6_9CHRO|nr:flavodoxin family protein [Aphanothece hegewaldii]PSF37866.1 flavodoxin family protein [Aphanothece hegewaldii CCALA 016]